MSSAVVGAAVRRQLMFSIWRNGRLLWKHFRVTLITETKNCYVVVQCSISSHPVNPNRCNQVDERENLHITFEPAVRFSMSSRSGRSSCMSPRGLVRR
jgi:hypothetical protein